MHRLIWYHTNVHRFVAVSVKEKSMKFIVRFLLIMLIPLAAFAEQKIVNVYAWTGEIPDFIVQQFEKETGIKETDWYGKYWARWGDTFEEAIKR